jgi:hypothetical protein
MSGTWDATILSAYAAEPGGPFAVDAVGNGEQFDVVADVRIGRNLMQFVDRCELFVSVRNLSRSTTMLSQHQQYTLAPQKLALNEAFRTQFASGWTAEEGDVLEVLATFKVTSGINYDYSMVASGPFIVQGPSPTAAVRPSEPSTSPGT